MPCDGSTPLLWCDHDSVQIDFSSSLLSKNIKSKKYRTTDASFFYVDMKLGRLNGERYMVRVFEDRILRRILGLKRDEITGQWRRLHNEQLYAV
jgi:hypothetical protein